MALFNPSTIPWVSAVQQVADSAGASADGEMTVRAHNSLRAAFQHFNGRYKWDFTRTEAVPLQVIGPFSIGTASASAGQASAAVGASHGILPEDLVIGSGFLSGTRVSATAASGFGIYGTITGLAAGVNVVTATFQRDLYDLPSDSKAIYSLRLLGANLALRYVGRRYYDRTVSDENSTSSPYWYDLFRSGSGGKIRLLPPPASSDVLQRRYYRRMVLASASGVTTALDIPEDYESYPIAWAKWHFLTDKGEGRKDQATVWMQLANEGLTTMLKEQTNVADDDLGFKPSSVQLGWPGDRSTAYLDWDYN